MNILVDRKNISPEDIERCRANFQWNSDSDVTITAPETADKVFFLVYANGTGKQLVNDGVTVFTGVDEVLDLDHNPIRLSQNGWALTATAAVFFCGFYVPVLAD